MNGRAMSTPGEGSMGGSATCGRDRTSAGPQNPALLRLV